jgi:hypothetical protein
MSHKGKIQLMFLILAPPDQVVEGDRIFRSHGPWMEATHHRKGDKALLSYNVSKAPELSNPLDLNSAPTGNTCFILREIYETDAGWPTTSRCPNRVGRTSQPSSSGWRNVRSRDSQRLRSSTRSGERGMEASIRRVYLNAYDSIEKHKI